jgi:hypothetical protein
MNWIRAFLELNKSLFLKGLLLLMAFLLGLQMGQSRLQRQWDAEEKTVQIAQAKQEQHVADLRLTQSQITQEIANEYAKRSKLVFDRQLNSCAGGVCNISSASGGNLSSVSETPTGASPPRTDTLFASQGNVGEMSCEQLSKDALQTTLMLVEVQRWYRYQSAIEH